MKCINNSVIRIISLCLVISLFLIGCGNDVIMPYNPNTVNNEFRIKTGVDSKEVAKAFATDICVTENDLDVLSVTIDEATAGGLFDATSAETIYAKNVHEQLNPASLTKVMTAYIALKYGHMEDVLTASPNVLITESGAQLLGLKEGDKMSLEQALYALLTYSANDAAVMIAEYLSGSVEGFAQKMNEEAKKLGATNTQFMNPHGLTAEGHYTTAYDLYLIFNAAMKFEQFRKIINTKECTITYKRADGTPVTTDVSTTNGYLSGDYNTPDNVSVVGGKTGTTKAAGRCLILLSNSTEGHTYVSVILHSEDRDSLYNNMTSLLKDIP